MGRGCKQWVICCVSETLCVAPSGALLCVMNGLPQLPLWATIYRPSGIFSIRNLRAIRPFRD